jgi:hypothetical protein
MAVGAIVIPGFGAIPGPGASTLGSGGTGYALGDTGTVAAPTNGTSATYQITAVNAGAVTAYILTNGGSGYTAEAGGIATTRGGSQPGGGSGFAINVVAVTTGLDLTTVGNLQYWLATGVISNASGIQANMSAYEMANLEACITAAGGFWLWRCGLASADGTYPAVSPFVAPQSYNEWYDGPGGQRLFLRHAPIQSVSLVQVSGVTVPQSTTYGIPGWVIDESAVSLAIREGGGGQSPSFTTTYFAAGVVTGLYFAKGLQNVNIQYTAGFNGVPADVELACRQMVATNYKRRQWIDMKSLAMGPAAGGGQTTYRDWAVEPQVALVMNAYSRVAPVY